LNCSAEQFGLVDCAVEAYDSCDCEGDPAQGDSDDDPCGLCDFITSGGVPTISPILLDTFDSEISSPPAWLIAVNQAFTQLRPPVAAARGSCFEDGVLAEPYELLARRTVPVRGPTRA